MHFHLLKTISDIEIRIRRSLALTDRSLEPTSSILYIIKI